MPIGFINSSSIFIRGKAVKVADGKSDALELVQKAHREIRELQRTVDELEYLVYAIDARCQIEFFKGGVNDKKRSET